MKLKTITAIALIISIIIVGNIILFGINESDDFIINYFLFTITLLGIIFYGLKSLIHKKLSLFFFVLILITLGFTITFLAMNANDYLLTSQYTSNQIHTSNQEISNINISIDYQNKYIQYLNEQIEKEKTNTQIIKEQILKTSKEPEFTQNGQIIPSIQDLIIFVNDYY